jgi:N-glycosylase/DNA lyase
LTPQSKALFCDKAISDLRKSGLLFKGRKNSISKRLKSKVRFHNNKAAYLTVARRLFSAQGGSASGGKNGKALDIKSKLDADDTLKTRDWLVKNVKGLGYKEASHFLRNIGLGKDIAIIDRHILENLKRYKILRQIPSSMGKKAYVDIENKIRKFARHVKIPLEELDLLFWSRQTGFIFK